jgi:hypothetical protein
MIYEFSKPEKKIVRQVIETGLQRDFDPASLKLIRSFSNGNQRNWTTRKRIIKSLVK